MDSPEQSYRSNATFRHCLSAYILIISYSGRKTGKLSYTAGCRGRLKKLQKLAKLCGSVSSHYIVLQKFLNYVTSYFCDIMKPLHNCYIRLPPRKTGNVGTNESGFVPSYLRVISLTRWMSTSSRQEHLSSRSFSPCSHVQKTTPAGRAWSVIFILCAWECALRYLPWYTHFISLSFVRYIERTGTQQENSSC